MWPGSVVLGQGLGLLPLSAPHCLLFHTYRMASCGRGSVRLWRLRGGVLRSCAVDLGEYCSLELSDLAFAQALDGHCAPLASTL